MVLKSFEKLQICCNYVTWDHFEKCRCTLLCNYICMILFIDWIIKYYLKKKKKSETCQFALETTPPPPPSQEIHNPHCPLPHQKETNYTAPWLEDWIRFKETSGVKGFTIHKQQQQHHLLHRPIFILASENFKVFSEINLLGLLLSLKCISLYCSGGVTRCQTMQISLSSSFKAKFS